MLEGRSGNRRLRRAAAIVLAGMAALAAGCATQDPPPIPVQIDDSGAVVRSARIVWRPGKPDSVGQRAGFEIDYTSHRGGDTQFVPGGQKIELGGIPAYGPQTVQHEIRAQYIHVAFNELIPTKLHAFASDRIELEILIGLSDFKLDLRTQVSAPATPEISNVTEDIGIVVGIAPRWRFGEYFAAEGRYTYMSNVYLPGGFSYLLTRKSAEIALAVRPVRQLSLRAGYIQTGASVVDTWNIDSEVQYRLRGPFLGATLEF